MSSGQTSANNKTWLARHLKTLFHTITPSGTMGRMAPAIGMTMTMAITGTLTPTSPNRRRRLPHVAAAGARLPSR
ncbi:hypothetical protein [Cupriavidus sp. MP-37]|uniref:hypothetical protein n=1 Tax=Cupriavidus sp. MP-37 TaxID=2884455 RepID=UPI001D0BDDF0|nr:hypothetical protein [Cupriavidus sp. MP-37]UDM54084.1 hypothetical protein LIN44_16865 [Cupriavidus sp. MP-37]